MSILKKSIKILNRTRSDSAKSSSSKGSTGPPQASKAEDTVSSEEPKRASDEENASELEEDITDDEVPSDTALDERLLPDIRKNPLEEIATTALSLGVMMGLAMSTLVYSTYKPPSLYIIALSLFHFLEFYITAKYNPKKVHKESFIINNGSSYTLAHSFAIAETAIEYYIFPNFKKSFTSLKIIGFILIIFGQVLRSWAMITAGKSFSHLISVNRQEDHELVTNGVYSVFRHPSYTGFFWWAIGTQLMLTNPISLIGFAGVLWMFFRNRIEFEERFLVRFFGEKYQDYRKTAFVYIPCIQ